MRKAAIWLLAGTSILISGTAMAQDVQPVAPASAADEGGEEGQIVVIGRGETRQVQQISASDIAELAAGTSPLKAIEKLPSVNFQSADPFGAYEWAQRVSIRGFNQNQLGFTLDGIPLGDASYGNVNGLHISRAISSENVGEVRVSQGAGSIGTQATNNLGGTLEFFSRDPSNSFGLHAEGTYGSENTVRLFGRIESGDLGGGVKAYASYVYSDMDKWKGWGSQRTNQANGKIVAPVAAGIRLVGTISYSDRRENDYQDLSLGMIQRLGYDWDNISNNYALAVRIADIANNRGDTGAPVSNAAAGTVYPAPITSVDDAYFDAAGLRRDWLGSFGVEGDTGGLNFALKGYYHNNHGQGLWYTPYVPSPGAGASPISIRTTEYDMDRKGVFGHLTGEIGGNNALTVGAWYENNAFQQARRFYALSSRTEVTRDSLDFQSNPFATQWDYDYTTDTFQYYVQDKLTLGALTLNLGWKGFSVKNQADPNVAGSLASGEIKVTDWFQPTAGFNFRLGSGAELFGGFSQVTRAFTASATTGPFATTQAGFNALLSGSTKLKPEQSDTYELGGRLRSGPFTGSLAGYYVNFRNRLLGVTTGAGIVGNPVTLQNVGDVRSLGFEATGDLRLGSGFGAFVSYSYNDSTYRDDVRNAAGTLLAATKGKTVVDAPKHLLKGELTYDLGGFNARVGANYMSKRYFTYTNDQSVEGRVVVDATLGYKFDLAGRQLEIQANATNLFDKKYISTIGTNGFGNSGDNMTLMVGAPQQFFVTLKAGF
ncbi:iron complex outermembrane receptor protein [Sphingomonas kyeonggiensis]|uniref:Iron complex outermembrane receptor protein n=1 Tax=Sphingomonas kyeonggiensis TaxID=1268553 RepID=A0A7W7JZM3_9SPHN|nr:TonB-dependent receptor [Sphingomonas kyeonggiensis]MBB4838331.1 iron complex outermembrane receptor protein [Sphingomonas kyeonggiensis]